MRTIIDLPADQLEALDRLCQRDGISRAEGVRRAVAEHVRQQQSADATQAFGLWRARDVDGLADRAAASERVGRSRQARSPATMKALFDTNILIDYLKGIEAAQEELARYRHRLVSIVTWMEVLAGAHDDAEADVIHMFCATSGSWTSRAWWLATPSTFAARVAAACRMRSSGRRRDPNPRCSSRATPGTSPATIPASACRTSSPPQLIEYSPGHPGASA